MSKLRLAVSLLIAGGLVSPVAHATNGYFSHGYGMKAKGMGGVGIALPQDSLAAASNPAGMVMVGNRLDVGVDWFRPKRQMELVGSGTYDGNGDKSFLIPEFGYNRMLNTDSSIGISVYGNGGMNTKYKTYNDGTNGTLDQFGQGDLGVDLAQMFIAPTYAMKLTPDHAVGISLNLAYQMFKAEGLRNFGVYSSAPNNLTNNGYDSSSGYGLRIGWLGNVTPSITLGATYQTKTRMSSFDKYKGLFAEQGDFDIPSNYGVGIAVKLTNTTTVAADIVEIKYSDTPSVNNPISGLGPGNLGTNNGAGFGWRDMTVVKLGISHQYDNGLTVRAGYNYGRQPIPESETKFNVLAPGVVEDHLTLGATWAMSNKSELTVGYMHAFKKTITGSGPGNRYNIKMYQDSLGFAYGWKM